MKIAVFHELNTGGARRAVNEFSKQLKKNHQVDLYIVDEKQDSNEKSFYSSIHFYKFIPKQWSGGNWKVKMYKDSVELYKLYNLHKKIAAEINKKNYDLVFIQPSKYTQAPFTLRFIKTKKIYYCQEPLRIAYDSLVDVNNNLDLIHKWYERINRRIRKKIDRKNLEYAQFYVTPSKYRSRLFSTVYKRTAHVVYCGVDADIFRPSIRKKDIDIFYIGSRDIIDGYDTLHKTLKIMKSKPNVRFLLYGEEWLETDAQLRDLYRRTKILICPARKEGLGLATLEAMACGVTVVAVDEAGHKETVIDGETGFLLPRNPKIIAEKLDWLLSHQDKTAKLGKTGREVIIKQWTWKSRTKELEYLFNQSLSVL